MNALRPDVALEPLVDRYLRWKRALGRGYGEVERVLVSLLQFMHVRGAADLDQILFDEWSKSFAELTANVRRSRQREVRNFCLFRQRTEPSCFVPDANRFPRPCPYSAPVIFGPDAVARMLTIAGQQRATSGSPLLPAVLRLAVVLLYTAGLRRGELLRLTLADADPIAGVLRIRESKFHKSRFVPLSLDACRELRAYLRKRLVPPLSTAPDSPLLCNCTRGLRPYTGTGLSRGLQLLIGAANVRSPDGRRPRVHDFRHNSETGIIPRAVPYSAAPSEVNGLPAAKSSELSEALQEVHHTVAWPEAGCRDLLGTRMGERAFLELHVCMKVD